MKHALEKTVFKTCHFAILRRKPCHCQYMYFPIVFALFSVTVTVSTHLCVICRHLCCPMSLFQGYVTCQSFTLTWPVQHVEWTLFKMEQILAFHPYFNNKKCTLYLRNDYLVYHFSGNLNLMFFFVFLYHHDHNSLHHHPHGAFSFSFPLLLDAAQPFECEWCKSCN